MFNFNISKEAVTENGFQLDSECENQFSIKLKDGLVLVFVNEPEKNDTGIFFEDGYWHSHGDSWGASYGIEEELVPLYILSDLKAGKLLIEKSVFQNGNIDLRLIYDYEINFSAKNLEPGEEITFIKL